MSEVAKTVYRCPLCDHEEDNPLQLPTCPQCAGDWVASVNTVSLGEGKADQICAPEQSSKAPTILSMPSTAENPQHRHMPDDRPFQVGSGIRDAADLSAKLPVHSAVTEGGIRHAPLAATATGASELPRQSFGQAASPFIVSVNKVPQPRDLSTVCLEIRIQNVSTELARGQIWLADRHGNVGSPESFELPGRASLATEGSGIVFPQLEDLSGALNHVAVRVKSVDSGVAFWQGDLLLHREKDGSITVEIDKSVRAETALGGIDNGVVNIYANESIGGIWQSVHLRRRGLKDLAHPSDAQRPGFSGRVRRVNVREDVSAAPPIESARLTLSRRLECGRESYVQLLAGSSVSLGRARTWDSAAHAQYSPNDIILRSLIVDESDDYISRYHGRLHISGNGVRYENLSGGGTDIAGRTLVSPGESMSLPDNAVIYPGRSVATTQHRSLGLRVRRTPSTIATASYILLAQDSHLPSSMDPADAGETVTLNRTDALGELEHYVVFPQSTLIGSNESLCGWQISADSVQQVHAILLWFDESFWVEPYSRHCEVRVDGDAIPVHRLRRLTAYTKLEIADQQFTVLPEWKQHILDCRCCRGHGSH